MIGQIEFKWKTACVWVSVCPLIAMLFVTLEVESDHIDKDYSYVETKVSIEEPGLERLGGLILCFWNI